MFWQPRLGDAGSPNGGGYREIANPSRLATAVAEAGWRAWPAAPILAGAATRMSRPDELDGSIAWADVVMVEFPWQFEHCRRRAARTPIVLCTHNLERAAPLYLFVAQRKRRHTVLVESRPPAPHHLDVLLRHRPRSISLSLRAHCQGRHLSTDKQQGLALR